LTDLNTFAQLFPITVKNHLHASLIFVGKGGAYQIEAPYADSTLRVGFRPFLEILGHGFYPVTNSDKYLKLNDTELIKKISHICNALFSS